MLSDLKYRLRALFRRGAMERDLTTELHLHYEREVVRLVAGGLSHEQARREARMAMGGIEQVKEATRDAWGVRLIESVIQDSMYAIRVLRKTPAFTVAVTMSLALGIGANTAIFTLMDAVMWRLLPVKEPEHLLVAAIQRGETLQPLFNYRQFRHIADSNDAAELAGYAVAPINVSIDGSAEPSVRGHLVTGDYFSLLGVSAVLAERLT